MSAPSVRQMQAAYDDLATEFDSLRREHNDLATEHKRLTALLANPRTATMDRLVAEKDAEACVRDGARVDEEMRRVADEQSRIMVHLAPARQTLREAQRTVAIIAELKGDEPDVVRYGIAQIKAEEKRLKTLIKQLEA